MNVRFEPEDFVRLIPEDLKAIVCDNDLRLFCITVNDMRAGKEVSSTVNIRWVKQLEFKKRRITLKNGNSFLLKSITEHRQFVGGVFSISIGIGPDSKNRIYREYPDGPIIWNCVKAEKQVFPTSGNEFLRVRFRKYDADVVNTLIEIHDDYCVEFAKAYNQILEESA